MVGLVLFSHSGLARAFQESIEMVAGPQTQVAAVGVDRGVSPDVFERELDRAIKKVDQGDGVIVLTDLFGGSPANLSLARLVPGRVEVISGLNLAMLLKAVDLRLRALTDPAVMARAIAREGRENIVLASDLLSGRAEPPRARSGQGGGG